MGNNGVKLWAVELTLAIGCKLNCKFCPQSKLVKRYIELFGRENLQMSFEAFTKILDSVEVGTGVGFAGMVEPFQNPDCVRMIRYAYEKGYKVNLATTLEGATLEDADALKDVDFDGIRLHIPDAEGNAHFSLSDEYIRVFKEFIKRKDICECHCHGTIHPLVKPYLNSSISVSSALMNRAGNLEFKELETFDHKGEVICGCGSVNGFGGWTPVVMPNGAVVLCCMDYGMKHVLGNLVTQTWREISESREYEQVEKGFDNESVELLCRKCPAAQKRENSLYREEVNLRGPNALRVFRQRRGYGNVKEKEQELLSHLTQAKHICIFGLGNLFRDNYFQSGWHNVIPADVFSDNDQSKWGTYIHGVRCVAPEELCGKEGLLVITYVKNDAAIQRQLKDMGIMNIVNIYDIFNARDVEGI